MTTSLDDPAAIAARLPQGPSMCLLQRVDASTAAHIRCRGRSVDSDGHPLTAGGRLHAVHALEYAAQAAAMHGSLYSDEPRPRPGLVAAVRDLAWDETWLRGTLTIECEQLAADARHCSYSFRVIDAVGTAVWGRLTVVFKIEAGQ